MTRFAPSRNADLIVSKPTGPQPQMAIVSVGLISQFSAAIQAVGKMSERNRTCSSLRPSGTFNGPTSA